MRTHIIRGALLVALLSIICTTVLGPPTSASLAAEANPGELDTTFAGFSEHGLVVPPSLSDINDIAVQPDGKIVVVGYTRPGNDAGVLRYLPDGQLDPTFDGDGKAQVPGLFGAYRVAVQSDGRIVVGGTYLDDFALARLNPDGTPDLSFDGDGWFQDFDDQLDRLDSILVQPDGKVVACGYAGVGGDHDFGIARYLANGARDTSYNGDGKVTIGFGGDDYCHDLALQTDGKLLAVGESRENIFFDTDFAIARLKLDGTPDTSFDGDGKLTTGFGDKESASSVVMQPDGKIVVLGTSLGNSSYIARYLPSGTLDDTFDGDGKLTIPVDRLYDLALLPDGKLLALGYHESPSGEIDFSLHQLLTDGKHDASFGAAGVKYVDFGGKDSGRHLAVLPDGRIFVAGIGTNIGLLARLWPDGEFDTGGKQTHTSAPTLDQVANAMTIQPDGKLVVAGEQHNPANTFSEAFVSRFGGDGQVDTAFGTLGTVRMPITSITPPFRGFRAIAIQGDGKIIAAGYAASISTTPTDFLIARWNSDGTLDLTFNTVGWRRVNFANGNDDAYAMALAPDGKIVVAGNAWNGSRQIWGVARLTSSGALDTSFGPNHDGLAYVDFIGANAANAVVVQPDRKIIVGGNYNGDFFIQRLLENGARDGSYGSYDGGYNFTDMGGDEGISALALDRDGSLYAAGSTSRGGLYDVALARYGPDGVLATCPAGQSCTHWPNGTRIVDLGGADTANALILRGDGQLVTAGCSGGRMLAAQISTSSVTANPLLFAADFLGDRECAFGVQWSDASRSKLVVAGWGGQQRALITLARFQTTPDATKRDQTISFPPLPDRITTDPSFTLSASASSGLAVSFSSSTPGVCSVSGTTLSLSGQAGSCSITATQAGNATYNPAASISRSFRVRDPAKQDQTITFPPLPDRLTTDPPFTLSATATSGLAVTFTSDTPGVCSVSGTTLSLSGQAGICTIVAVQAGNTEWNPALEVSRSFAVRDVAKREQTITIEPDPLPQQLAREQLLTLRATASSGLAVEIASSTPATCVVLGATLGGATVEGQAAGVCRISVSQAGDAQWNPVRRELVFTITTPPSPGHQIWLPLLVRS